jgi:hypothetical protein
MPSERIDTFEPVPISNESGDVRTPVSVWVLNPYRYMVTVGDYHTKFFSDETVPQEIKALIAMVRAFPEDVRMNRSFGPGIYVPPDPRLACIGWQLIPRGPDWEAYILVLSQKLFERIRW